MPGNDPVGNPRLPELRLSLAVPFNLQNYLYGVTAIRFWPCVLASWIAMLPGTFLYVYLGSLGRTAAAGETTMAEWVARGIGPLATIAVTIYLARLARHAIETRTRIEGAGADEAPSSQGPSSRHGESNGHAESPPRQGTAWPWRTLAMAALAVALFALALWASVRRDAVQQSVERLLGMPPTVTAVEAYVQRRNGPTFDHSTFGGLLRKHVDAEGWVDYDWRLNSQQNKGNR